MNLITAIKYHRTRAVLLSAQHNSVAARAHALRALTLEKVSLIRGEIKREKKMSLEFLDTPENQVGSTVHSLKTIIGSLIEMRIANATADLMLQEEPDLKIASVMLSNLLEDIERANLNGKKP